MCYCFPLHSHFVPTPYSICMCMCVNAGGWLWVSSCSPPFFAFVVVVLKWGLSLNLDPIDWLNWVANVLRRSACLLCQPHPQHWDYICVPPHLAFTCVFGSQNHFPNPTLGCFILGPLSLLVDFIADSTMKFYCHHWFSVSPVATVDTKSSSANQMYLTKHKLRVEQRGVGEMA